MKRVALVVISTLLTVTCDSDRSLRSPTTPSAPPLTTLAIRSVIQGTPPSLPPGRTTQLNLIARFNDGSERDVTTEAQWTSSQVQIATVDAGAVTGQAPGRANIRATYMSRDAFLAIAVKPDGTFVVSGTVTEAGPFVVAGATVATLGSPSIQVTTNSAGFYELFGVPSTFTMRVSKAGYLDDTRTVTVTQDQRVDVQIRQVSGRHQWRESIA
jgi:Carboxypeptidase regulatory-like domain/Bacterial Ig-like domain (group 2)